MCDKSISSVNHNYYIFSFEQQDNMKQMVIKNVHLPKKLMYNI